MILGNFLKPSLISLYCELSMGSTTVLTRASSNGTSLRTTVPKDIVRQFNLNEGDKLSWEIQAHNNELTIVVKPIQVTNRA